MVKKFGMFAVLLCIAGMLFCASAFAADPIVYQVEALTSLPDGTVATDGEREYVEFLGAYRGTPVQFQFTVEEVGRYDLHIDISCDGAAAASIDFALDDTAINYRRFYDTTNLIANQWTSIDLGQYQLGAGSHTLTATIYGTNVRHRFDKMTIVKNNNYSFFAPCEMDKGTIEKEDAGAAPLTKFTNASYGYVNYVASEIGGAIVLNAQIDSYGEYDLSVIVKGSTTRGKFQVYVNDEPIGGILSFSSFYDYREISVGTVTLLPGIVKVKFEFVEANTGTGIILSQINFKARENGFAASEPQMMRSGEAVSEIAPGDQLTIAQHTVNYGEAVTPVMMVLLYDEIDGKRFLRQMQVKKETLEDVAYKMLEAMITVDAAANNPQLTTFLCVLSDGVLKPVTASKTLVYNK